MRPLFFCLFLGMGRIGHAFGDDVSHHIGTGHDNGGNLGDSALPHAKGQHQRGEKSHNGQSELAAGQFSFPVNHHFLLILLHRLMIRL